MKSPYPTPATATAPRRAQRGIVLASCLVLIVVMTAVALATGSAITLEQHIERNLASSGRALAAAESAARVATVVEGGTFAPGRNPPTVAAVTAKGVQTHYRIRYLGFQPVAPPCNVGGEDGDGKDGGWHHFELRAGARTPGAASATVRLGLAWCAAPDHDGALHGRPRRIWWWQEHA